MSSDPNVRSPGRVFADGWLDNRVLRALRRSSDALADAHLRVAAQDGLILLLGQVANEEDRVAAGNTAAAVPGVRRVHNELQLGGATSYVARANDRWLATKVRSTLLWNDSTRVGSLRVVAENGTVFLLGKVSRSEVIPAVTATRRVFGVERVVKVFDYVDTDPDSVSAPVAVALKRE
ncbi:MAG: BON domain-containing protein [Pseudomonadota bacterium]